MQIAQQQRLAASRRQITSEQAAAFGPATVNDQRCISAQNIASGALAISGPSACRAPDCMRKLAGNGDIQRRPVYAGLAATEDALNPHPRPVAATVQAT